ncbi:STAS domain-containing protein [Candidatus Woesearchaeota archaeon]|nr:STAS domain-containing protein [Candidatus Woesearchaeota archaeon]MCF8012995.1 STAS domain-containing protein [Candidatus Woesearchaeota archaeon]
MTIAKIDKEGNSRIITFQKERIIGLDFAKYFEKLIEEISEKKIDYIQLNFEAVTFIDSGMLRRTLELSKLCKKMNVGLQLIINSKIEEILAIAGMSLNYLEVSNKKAA